MPVLARPSVQPSPSSSAILDLRADLGLAGTWTEITSFVYSERAKPVISRGRPDESSQAVASSAVFQLNNRDNRFSVHNPVGAYYPNVTRNTPFRMSVPDSGIHLRLEGDNSSYVSCPNASSLNLSGDLEARIDLNIRNWTASSLAGMWKFTDTGGNWSWWWGLNADGTLTFAWTTDGSTINTATSTQPLPWPGGRISLFVTYNHTNGDVQFHYATSLSGSQTRIGRIVNTGASGALFAGNAALAVGWSQRWADLTGFQGTYGAGAGVAWAPATYNGLQGKVYEFQLRNGIGGSLVADPVFSSEPVGVDTFTDAQGNTWTLSGTAELTNRKYRYHGEVGEWPPRWDESGRDVYVEVQANGLLRRLQQGTVPLRSAMSRAWARETGPYAPVAYWPVEDGSSAHQIASGLSDGNRMAVSPGGSLGGASPFDCTIALGSPGTGTWTGVVPSYVQPAAAANVLRFLLSVPSGGDTDQAVLARCYAGGTCQLLSLHYGTTGSGSLELFGFQDGGGTLFDSGMVIGGVNGNPCLVEMALTVSGGTLTWHLNVLFLATGAQTGQTGTFAGSLGHATLVEFGPTSANVQSSFGQIAVQAAYAAMDSTTSAYSLIGPLNAWQGETAGLRFARLCTEQGYASRVVGYPSASVVMGSQLAGATFMQLLQECEDADHGMIYEPRQALALAYRCHNSLVNQGSGLSGTLPVVLSYTAAHLGGGGGLDIQPVDDDLLTINDETATRQAGASTGSSRRVTETGSAYSTGGMSTSAPPAGAGAYQDTRTINVLYDSQLRDQAGWLVHLGTVDELRYPSIPVDLARTELASFYNSLQDLDLGDYLQVTSPPAWLSPDTVKVLLWGLSETVGGYIFTIEYQTQPESPFEVLVAGTGASTDCRADTDGSTLSAGYGAADTTLSVATATGFPLWTTTAGDFPFDILVAGERMTVTNITGASSPQTFTVTRSVNGVTKIQAAGGSVALFSPVYLALA